MMASAVSSGAGVSAACLVSDSLRIFGVKASRKILKIVLLVFVWYHLYNRGMTGETDMTLQQLKYVITVAEKGSITEAAKELFISQPSLSGAIKEVENEAKITIFNRCRAGVALTTEGMEFSPGIMWFRWSVRYLSMG